MPQIRSETDVRQLEAAWRAIQGAGGVFHPMYTWEWASTWWEIFSEGRSLVAAVAYEDDVPMAIAPFVRRKAQMNRLFTFRRLELLGTGEEERDEVFSEYIDFPVRPGTDARVLESLAAEVLRTNDAGKWDDVVLCRVRPESAVSRSLQKCAAQEGLSVTTRAGTCPYAALPGSMEEYDRGLSSNRRQQIRRGVRALEKMGEVSFEKATTLDAALAALDLLAELHQLRWTAKDRVGAFAGRRFRAFHRTFIERSFDRGWPELWTLRVGDTPLACLYNIRYEGKVAFYQSGVRPIEDGRVRPGMLAHYFAIRASIERGDKEYDFMLGGSQYKTSLSNAAHELVTVRMARFSAKEMLRRMVVSVVRPAKRILAGGREEKRS